ncbi:MAG: UDP-N-acetylmuramoyl-L-alanine--D-glutamate ligase [Clostridiales Family XIII bacterium]|jgi:UDP-N-acetylmuramoylalanine--D-glutamate ligase|nr:UDP-N-acetylmuramoyl-L-alanine--D-glutamate ligase [Clostridiales Family XIII bacterium]
MGKANSKNKRAGSGKLNEGRYAGKNVLVAGMGKSGVAAMKYFARAGAGVAVYDAKDIEWGDKDLFARITALGVTPYFNGAEPPAEGWDYIIKSPGVPPDLGFIAEAREKGAVLMSDLDPAYEIAAGDFIAITGTNGKTTTTALVGEIYGAAGVPHAVTGNIGVPVIETAAKSAPGTVFVTEISSFQLEDAREFRPKIAAILNLTPDHLDRHGTMERYGAAKANVFARQTEDDYLVYNADDELVAALVKDARSMPFPFSRIGAVDDGAFVKGGRLVIADAAKGRETDLIAVDELRIPGAHNIENALAAAAIAYSGGIDPKIIAESLKAFKGVEHRMEYVASIGGVKFVNDSKGTNPDASAKAIEASAPGILLIAGGYDKHSDFRPFVRGFGGKVKHLLLLGKTAERFKEEAASEGFSDATVCEDMGACVRLGLELAAPGDTVLLSPASASWDMYSCFEERGGHFKRIVDELASAGGKR